MSLVYLTIKLYFFRAFLLSDAQETITASRGDSVVLPCSLPFEQSDRVIVKWEKDGESVPCHYNIEHNSITHENCTYYFQINANPHNLTIKNVASSDAGVYNCSLTKVIPPPTEDKSLSLILKVHVSAGLIVEQMNSSNHTCVDLLCSLEGLSPEQVNFTWTRESELLLSQNSSTSMSSILKHCKPHWRDGETITCHANYSNNHTIYSKNITLKYTDTGCCETQGNWLIGLVIGVCVGLLLIILLAVAVRKCKKVDDSSDSIVFSNKVYENLSFFTSRPNAETTPSFSATTTRPNPPGQCQQKEECIYEN